MFLKSSVDLSTLFFSNDHIDFTIKHAQKGIFWSIGFYGHPDVSRRKFSLDLLQRLHQLLDLSWFILGYFIEILSPTDKLGGCPRPMAQIDNFSHVVNDCSLRSLAFQRYKYTWNNGHEGSFKIHDHLLKGFANSKGLLSFSFFFVCCDGTLL